MMLVVFDVDGTLVDSQHAIAEAMAAAYRQHALDAPTREAVRGVVGLSVPEAIAMLSAGSPDHPQDSLGQAFKQSFMTARKAEPDAGALYPGALETLRALAARDDVLLGLATGNSRRGVARFVDHYGLQDMFVTKQSADDAPSKPDPAMVLQAAAEAGVSPQDAVMVGDTTYDMLMARAARARALGVAWGYHEPERLLAAGAERILPDFDALLPALGLPNPANAA